MAGMYQPQGGVFDPGGQVHNPVQNLDAIIARLGIGQAAQPSQQQQRTIINELDEIFSELSPEQRKVVEANDEYTVALGAVLQKFIFYLISRTPDGFNFVTGPGKKQAQVLLDVTKKITEHIDEVVKDDFKEMQQRMAQMEAIIIEQNKKTQEQEAKLAAQAEQLTKFKASLGE